MTWNFGDNLGGYRHFIKFNMQCLCQPRSGYVGVRNTRCQSVYFGAYRDFQAHQMAPERYEENAFDAIETASFPVSIG